MFICHLYTHKLYGMGVMSMNNTLNCLWPFELILDHAELYSLGSS